MAGRILQKIFTTRLFYQSCNPKSRYGQIKLDKNLWALLKTHTIPRFTGVLFLTDFL
jgi:hypothetical protein